jgi:putative acetyltransferase
MTTVTIDVESPRADGVLELLTLGDEFTLALYPPDSCYLLDVGQLEAPGVTVFVARSGGSALGMAALVERGDGTAEVKRMFVRPEARGLGIARRILDLLDETARAHSVHTVQLETGPLQPEAIGLYEKHGYHRIPGFGPYAGDDYSVCMEKSLG